MDLDLAAAIDTQACTWPGCPREADTGRWCGYHRGLLKRAARQDSVATRELLGHCAELGRKAARRNGHKPARPVPQPAVAQQPQAVLEARARERARQLHPAPGGFGSTPAVKRVQVQTLDEALTAMRH